MNVASVPKGHARELSAAPPLRRVLVATDFSENGNRAVPLAVSLLPNGGTIHLVHVLTPALGETPVTALITVRGAPREEWLRSVATANDRLDALVPELAASRGVEVVVDVLEGYVADEVCRVAERLDVGLLCIGSRARPSLSAAILGSTAQEIVAKSRRPVVIVPPRDR
jgi:nucleotide-binding universal stress UspA family protein